MSCPVTGLGRTSSTPALFSARKRESVISLSASANSMPPTPWAYLSARTAARSASSSLLVSKMMISRPSASEAALPLTPARVDTSVRTLSPFNPASATLIASLTAASDDIRRTDLFMPLMSSSFQCFQSYISASSSGFAQCHIFGRQRHAQRRKRQRSRQCRPGRARHHGERI